MIALVNLELVELCEYFQGSCAQNKNWYDDNGDNTLFSTLMTLRRATRISLSKKSKTD